MKILEISTSKREEFIDVTELVKKEVKEAEDCKALLLFVPHTSCALFINEGYDPNVCKDISKTLNKITENIEYEHSEGNSDAHSKTVLVGNSLIIPIENKELVLGTWQRIFLAEFDGPRKRKIIIQSLK